MGANGTADGEFYALGITTDTWQVHVADSDNHRIQKFDPSGTFPNQMGANGSADGEFYAPRGMRFDSSGNVHVADWTTTASKSLTLWNFPT